MSNKDLIENLRNRVLYARMDNFGDAPLGSEVVKGGTLQACLDAANALEAMEWRPIEDIPKEYFDGRDVPLYADKTGELFICFHATQVETGRKNWIIARSADGTCFILKNPTHFLAPLPTPPKNPT